MVVVKVMHRQWARETCFRLTPDRGVLWIVIDSILYLSF